MSDTILSLVVGPYTFALHEYKRQETPVRRDAGRTGTKVKLSGEGYVDGETLAALNSAIRDLDKAFRMGGQDVSITTIGGNVELLMPASACADGGPHVDFVFEGGDNALQRAFTFSIDAEYGKLGTGDVQAAVYGDAYKEATKLTPDGRIVLTRNGDVTGPDAPTHFEAVILPALKKLYPWPQWAIEVTSTRSDDLKGIKANYSVALTQMSSPLPGTAGGTRAVNGTVTLTVDRDDRNRRKKSYVWDLTFVGDPIELLDAIRPKAVDGEDAIYVIRERYSISGLKESRLTATFDTIEVGDKYGSLDWERDVTIEGSQDEWQERTYPGAEPILVRLPKRHRVISESGKASGPNKWPKEPEPLSEFLTKKMSVRFSGAGSWEKYTAWQYTGFVATPDPNSDPTADDSFAPSDLARNPTQAFYGDEV